MSAHAELERAPAAAVAFVAAPRERAAADADADADAGRLAEEGLRASARPLDPATHELMRRGFAQDFAEVRVHAGPGAARSAAALGAEAYTVGRDIAFARGRYAPATSAGTRLIAHELAHVVQQRGAARGGALTIDGGGEPEAQRAAQAVAGGRRAEVRRASRPLAIQRDPTPGSPDEQQVAPINIPYPGGGRLTLIPGPGPLSLLGQRFPLPGSLRLTNALGLGAGPTGVIDIDPRHLVLSLLGSVDLQSSATAGTPPGQEGDPRNQSRVRLDHTIAAIDLRSGALTGSATLHVPSSYPPWLHPGTDVDVRATSNITDPTRWTLGANYGPVTVDASIQLHYDLGRLTTALSSGVGEVGAELAAPGVSVSGTGRVFGLPFSKFGLEAPTTRRRSQPLLGAPTPFPSTLYAAGAIVAPAGSLTSIATPALGFTVSSFGDRSGFSATAAALPTLSPEAISAGGPASSRFPVLGFADVSYVRRISTGFEIGVRATAQLNSAQLLNPTGGLPEPQPGERKPEPDPFRRGPDPLPAPISPFFGLSVFGDF